MTGVGLAACSALLWGAADYCGGRASRHVDALVVTVVSQIIGLPLLLAAVIGLAGWLRPGDVAWGAIAGVAGLLGIVLLYRGLSGGAMVTVAPITAVTAAVVPLLVGLFQDRLPSATVLSGAVCAVAAIGLVSMGNTGVGNPVTGRRVVLALTAGAMFGVFFVLLAQTHDDSGMWPVVAMRSASICLGLLVLLRRRVLPRHRVPPLSRISFRLSRPRLALVAAAGVGDTSANALYLLAAREGLLSVVAPIAALYPVSTVLLALTVDQERVRRVQVVGLGLAAVALVLTAR